MSQEDYDRLKEPVAALTLSVMSEEESEDEDGETVLVKRPFAWESNKLKKLKASLDDAHLAHLSPHNRHSKYRVKVGLPISTLRDVPEGVRESWVRPTVS